MNPPGPINPPGLSHLVTMIVGVVVVGGLMIVAMRGSRRRDRERSEHQGGLTRNFYWIAALLAITVGLISWMSSGERRVDDAPREISGWVGVAAGLIVISLLCLGVWSVWLWWRTPRERPVVTRPPMPITLWVAAGYGLFLGWKIAEAKRAGSPGVSPWLVVLPVVVGVLLLTIKIQGDRAIRRALKRANRGDVAGAIADLHAVVNRQEGRSTDPTSGADNPWAAPRGSEAVNTLLAQRLNMLGVLEGMRTDWSAAFDWYRAAERVGGAALRPVLLGNQGAVLVKLGRTSEGAPLLLQALAQAGERDAALCCLCRISLATALIDRQEANEAGKVLDQAEADWRRLKGQPARVRQEWRNELDSLQAKLASDPPGPG